MAYLPVVTLDLQTHHVTYVDNGLVLHDGPDGLTAELCYSSGTYKLDTDPTRGDARHQAEIQTIQAAWRAKIRQAAGLGEFPTAPEESSKKVVAALS